MAHVSDPSPHAAIHWPDGLDEAAFLARHWQREPLLIRQALPGFHSPLSADELAGLALEPDTTPRLIRREGGDDGLAEGSPAGHGSAERYTLEHGPFDAGVFETLGPRDWSLLVTDVEKHLPGLADWIAPFRLAPDWRLDDLMISYAPDGASVGAHVDEYDVFLLQASGTRRWSIARPADDVPNPPDARLPDAFSPVREHRTVAGGDLALLAAFEPSDSWDLAAGDVLYLPPGVPHHGVAVGEDCTTWSIGFRSPSAVDAFLHVAELAAGRLPHARLRDGGTGRGEPGRIEAGAVAAVRALWERATRLDETAFVELTGRLLTRGGTTVPVGGGPLDTAFEDRGNDAANDPVGNPYHVGSVDSSGYRPSPFACIAWAETDDGALLFVDGDCLPCSNGFARRACDPDGAPLHLPSQGNSDTSTDADVAAFTVLLERGALIRHDPDEID